MILKPLQHKLTVITEVDSLVVVAILGMLKLIVSFYPLRINYANQLKSIESKGLEVKVASCIIDASLVTLLEEVFSLHLDLFGGIIQKYTCVLVPLHEVCIVLVASLCEYLVSIEV
jgi:uncharacterized membrane protein YqhA